MPYILARFVKDYFGYIQIHVPDSIREPDSTRIRIQYVVHINVLMSVRTVLGNPKNAMVAGLVPK